MKDLSTIQQGIENTAIATGVSVGTSSVGISGMMGWVHSEISVIAAIVGIIASLMVISCQAVNIRKMRIETRLLLKSEKKKRRNK